MNYLEQAQKVIEIEKNAIETLAKHIDEGFNQACERIQQCQGRTVILGVGKSGLIGSKIAATLSSTGTPAFFVHAGEASHGDLGMITAEDIVIAISYSGNTPEIVSLLPVIKRLGSPLISMTGNPNSTLAQAADINLDVGVDQEACPHNLAPTASTTATLVMGDALAVSLLIAKGFTAEDFAFSHPGGSLGKRLLLRVSDVMATGTAIPKVTADTSVQDTILEMTNKRLGMTTVTDENDQLLGVFTDGDIRRSFEQKIDLSSTAVGDLMTENPKTINQNELAAQAMHMMETHKITAIICTNDQQHVTGVIHIHQLLESGIM